MNDKPAILGGIPIFQSKLSIVRPWLPSFASMSPQIQEMLSTRIVTKGNYLNLFEEKIAQHLGVKHAIGVSSCTTGLMLTYRCLGLAGEVIVPSFTFMASVSSLVWAGLKPIFVDVQKETTNIDPGTIENVITPRTTAIVAVHNFGAPTAIDQLAKITQKYDLKLIFDAAHGMGSLYQGRPLGGFGNAEVFSMSPTKLLIAGEGGIVTTNDDELARKIRIGREYGNSGNYDSEFAGFNSRLAEFNCLLGIHSLALLEQTVKNRNGYAAIYRNQLSDIPGLAFQTLEPGNRSSYKDFSILIDPELFGMSRNQLSQALGAENIDVRHYYDPPVHRQKAYCALADPRIKLENTDILSQNCLSLPIYSHMDQSELERVVIAIKRIHKHRDDIEKKNSS